MPHLWSWSTVALAAGIFAGVGLVTALGILFLEAQRRRDQRAAAIQDQIGAPLAKELGAAGVSVLPIVHIPLWKGATRPALIELTGEVSTRTLRDRVIRITEREAARLRYFRIEDHLRISRDVGRRRRRSA